MSVKLRITVTKEILERSKNCGVTGGNLIKEMPTNCAIALAIRDIFPNAFVEIKGIFLDAKSYLNFYVCKADIELPQTAKDFIDVFDWADPEDRIALKPISFEIEIPDSVIDQINIEELRPLLANHPSLQLV